MKRRIKEFRKESIADKQIEVCLMTNWNTIWKSRKMATNPSDFSLKAHQEIQNQAQKIKDFHLLDLGCGHGADSIYFANQGYRVTALDRSQEALDQIKTKNPDIFLLEQDLNHLQLGADQYDAIYAHLSLHYFADPELKQIASQIHTSLKSDGLLFVRCKSEQDPLFGQGKKISEDTFELGHRRRFFTPDLMANAFSEFHLISNARTTSHYHAHKSHFIEAVFKK